MSEIVFENPRLVWSKDGVKIVSADDGTREFFVFFSSISHTSFMDDTTEDVAKKMIYITSGDMTVEIIFTGEMYERAFSIYNYLFTQIEKFV